MYPSGIDIQWQTSRKRRDSLDHELVWCLRIQVEWILERFNDGKNFTLAVDTDVLQFNQPVPRLQAIHVTETPDWYLIFDPLDRDDIGNLTCNWDIHQKEEESNTDVSL